MADLDLPRKRQRDGPVIESSMGTVGLQSAQTFKADLDVKRRREEEKMANVDATLQGQGAATVFRDKSGRKVDMVGELLKKSEDREARAAAEAEARYDWGTGLADKAAAATAAEEERKAASAPFARYRDDKDLDALLRSKIHDDDPMAEVMRRKAEKKAKKAAKKLAKDVKKGKAAPEAAAVAALALKPQYKGTFPANRFNIRPGYRWDGVDRGNGWERKALAASKSGPYRS